MTKFLVDSLDNEVKKIRSHPKTWLITGVAGFIGSNLLQTLLELDQHVIGVDNFATGFQKNLDQIQNLMNTSQWQRFRFIHGDIQQLACCMEACKEANIVLHHAALGSVPRSITNPQDTHNTNVNGFLNMLIAARDHKIEKFVYASSSSVYGDHLDLPKTETKIGNPLSPYAITKVTNELYARVFFQHYQLPSIGLRYFNVFGPRQNPKGPYAAVIPTWVHAILKGETVYINGDGEISRDFCYIKNVIQINLLAALSSQPSALNRVYNVACHANTTLSQLYKIIDQVLHQKVPSLPETTIKYREFRAGDIRHSLADISLAHELLGYKPQFDVEHGLRDTLDWYIRYLQ